MPPKVGLAIKIVRYYGWLQVRMRGSHRHFTHEKTPGTVSIPGHESETMQQDTWASVVRQGNLPKRIFREYSTWKRWR